MSDSTSLEKPQATLERRGDRIRLDFLDGLRGLAALYVVMFHVRSAVAWTGHTGGLSKWAYFGSLWMGFGRSAVPIFIVLSGYCLTLPVVRSADGKLRNGFGSYIKRRALRILPPYYAVLLLSLLVNTLVVHFWGIENIHTSLIRPDLTPVVWISHLLLIHNLNPDWSFRINFPLWSVATEWQIYFFLPLLLFIWKRWGIFVMVMVAFAIGLSPLYLFHTDKIDSPHFLGLFALGMLGAIINFGSDPRLLRLRRVPWSTLSLMAFLLFAAILLSSTLLGGTITTWIRTDGRWVPDVVVGLAAMCLIIWCAQETRVFSEQSAEQMGGGTGRNRIKALLESRPAMLLGEFSYSLYLTHTLVLGVLHLLLMRMGLAPNTLFLVLFVVGTTASLGVGYLFYLAFERPFTRKRA